MAQELQLPLGKVSAGWGGPTGGGRTGDGSFTPGVSTVEAALVLGVKIVTRAETVGDCLSGVETVGGRMLARGSTFPGSN